MLEFSRSLYLGNHLSESIHSWAKGTLPFTTPPLSLPLPSYSTPTDPTNTLPKPLRIHTHAHKQASRSQAMLSCDSSYIYSTLPVFSLLISCILFYATSFVAVFLVFFSTLSVFYCCIISRTCTCTLLYMKSVFCHCVSCFCSP